jgi:hypothetical protein
MITTLGLLAALIAIPILIRVGIRVFALLFVRAALVKGAEDIGRRALEKQSDHIHMVRAGAQVWTRPDLATALATPLLENGFQDAGIYTVTELPGVHVHLLTDSHNQMLGIVYEHPRAGHWAEVVTRYANGDSSVFTTVKPTGLSPRPGHVTVHAPGLDVGALLHRALHERPNGAMVPMTPAKAVEIFEFAYADQMAWRKKQGISASEVVRVAQRRSAQRRAA